MYKRNAGEVLNINDIAIVNRCVKLTESSLNPALRFYKIMVHFKKTTMKQLLTLAIIFFTLTAFGQQMTLYLVQASRWCHE